jgi:hypothetical protein
MAVTVAAVELFLQFGSGLFDAAAAPILAFPVERGLNVTVNDADAFAASDETRHVTTLRHHVQPLLFENLPSDDGSVSSTQTFRAVAGPALVTVSVQVALTLTRTDVGHDNATEMSALVEAGGGVVTVTLNGPAVACPTVLVAITEYVNDFVPFGGVPLRTPVTGSIDSHDGAPCVSEYVGAGYPSATNA